MIPQYTFYKTKYGDELLIDVVPLEKIKKYTVAQPVHTLTYYDITLITEGAGAFHIDNRTRQVNAGDIIFSRPGEIRQWDSSGIRQGYALIFEEEFLVSFFNDPDFL
ncbi:MAG: AraC family ligand binding domain-containing protein, partial [Tannerella sp.]|nr:AraC family ligand binding domain-containing protein [Tannerella sp.]